MAPRRPKPRRHPRRETQLGQVGPNCPKHLTDGMAGRRRPPPQDRGGLGRLDQRVVAFSETGCGDYYGGCDGHPFNASRSAQPGYRHTESHGQLSIGRFNADATREHLGAFDATRTAMTVSTLARRVEIPLATTHRLVAQLVEQRLLERADTGEVRLGIHRPGNIPGTDRSTRCGGASHCADQSHPLTRQRISGCAGTGASAYFVVD
ncbi:MULTISPECIES: helix-turn-helix domain-containing protein [Cryobacterium]